MPKEWRPYDSKSVQILGAVEEVKAKGGKMEKTGFLEEAPGKTSSMRLMSVMSLCTSIAFGAASLLHQPAIDSGNGPTLAIAFLVTAFAPKVAQKFPEMAAFKKG